MGDDSVLRGYSIYYSQEERIISIKDLGVLTRDFSWIMKDGKIQLKDLLNGFLYKTQSQGDWELLQRTTDLRVTGFFFLSKGHFTCLA